EGMLPRYENGKRKLSLAQALSVTRSYQETEGLHPALRRALAMQRVFTELPIDLLPGQLLLGGASSGPHIVDFTPEFFPLDLQAWQPDSILSGGLKSADQFYVFDPEDQQVFEQEIWPYWRTHARTNYFYNELNRHYPQAWAYMRDADCARYSPLIGGGLAHSMQDYLSILQKGLLGIKQEISEQIAGLSMDNSDSREAFERRNIYEAMLIVADGLITYANRNADLADFLAEREKNPDRTAELRSMAAICRKVPAHPAESWWEALQAFHFLCAGTALSEGGDSHSVGRFDQYMLPYLQHDLDAGKITPQDAQQLLECLFLKWNETRAFKPNLSIGSSGGGNNAKINIGGMDVNGSDTTNSLSYMLLEAHAHVHLVDPNLSLGMHKGTPDRLLQSTLEVLRLGGGLPILINDDVIIPALVSCMGVELAHARNYGDAGCQENSIDPNTSGVDINGRNNTGWINLPKPLELALHNGVNPRNGKQVGPPTGDPRNFTTMDQFLDAVRKQINYAVEMNVIINNVYDQVFVRYFPCVYHDLMYPGPRQSGVDIQAGGCRYNSTGALAIGMANAGDILAAVDDMIFVRKEATWDELLTALRNNWEGEDDLRRKFIAAPKYGADDEYADKWARTALQMWTEAYESHSTPRGGRFVMGLLSMGNYVTLGAMTGATPDGRKSGAPLADATSPSNFAPVFGPTAAHQSVVRAIDTYHAPNGVTFNQRFNLTAVGSPRDLRKWMDLVRSYMDLGGQQVQYTIVDGETLREAQKDPATYRDLLVRVGGYSAIFVQLSKEVQDTIIERAEMRF
ncbi:MAG: hypothetical protein H0S79_24980, partial [Anaerolineaceae bacterium]|nr:hypothetical protein [Anaerolineaceae bacterium]